MLKKAAYLLFISALIITIVESIYLFNYVLKNNNSSSESLGSFFHITDSSKVLNDSKGSDSESGILNQGYWDYLQTVGRKTLSSVTATLTCSGLILKVRNEPGINPADNQKFEKVIRLKDGGKDCEFLVFDALSLKNTKFVKRVGKENIKINFEDFKEGDRIVSVSNISLIKPQDASEATKIIQTTVTKL